jgi:hypothetical protein
MVGQLRVWPIVVSIPFRTNVIIDAELTPNDRGLKLLSSILPDSSRTFAITGQLDIRDASDGEFVLLQPPLDAKDCPAGAVRRGIVYKRDVLEPNDTVRIKEP